MHEAQAGNSLIQTIRLVSFDAVPAGPVGLSVIRDDHGDGHAAPRERPGQKCLLQFGAADAVHCIVGSQDRQIAQADKTDAWACWAV